MKILIVGGTGMLGHRLWMDLSSSHDVWGTVRGNAESLPTLHGIVRANICEYVDAIQFEAVQHIVQTIKPDVVIKALESYGIKPRGAAQGTPGPLVHYINMRMENRGGAREGTPELYFTDPDGLAIQLQDVKYCGGAGILGDVCR